MLSKTTIKLITSLRKKKYRDLHGLFIAEGPKLIQDFLDSKMELEALYSSTNAFSERASTIAISKQELSKISALTNPNQALAVFKHKQPPALVDSGLRVALDGIQDPGNLGTIIRLCDWFGVSQLWCTPDTVDCYNPKVVQATMGSLARVSIAYAELEPLLNKQTGTTYGGFMHGDNVYKLNLKPDSILVLGNEGNGISDVISNLIQHKISIPRHHQSKVESLNVATAAAILLSEFSRAIEK